MRPSSRLPSDRTKPCGSLELGIIIIIIINALGCGHPRAESKNVIKKLAGMTELDVRLPTDDKALVQQNSIEILQYYY